MKIEYEDHFFPAQDGIRLLFRRWSVARPKGFVAVVHGFAEHSGRYEKTAEALCGAGWSVAAFDYRGHGQSGGRRAHIDGFGQYLDDLRVFLDQVRKVGWAGPYVLLGNSQGGLIASRYAEVYGDGIAGLVLSSPLFGMAVKISTVKAWAAKALSVVMPTLRLKTGLNSSWISRDQAEVDRYNADPLVSHIASVRWYTEVLAAQAATMRESKNIRVPLLVLQAGDDRLVSPGMSRRFFEMAGTGNKTFKLYEGYFHEVFNEVGGERVVADMLDWLEEQQTSGNFKAPTAVGEGTPVSG